jgi:translation initiation factor 1 (eIF-1/SUI1)
VEGNLAREKKKKIDVSTDREDLTDNPFAALANQLSDADQALPNRPEKPKAEIMPTYQVARTRKGNWPVRMEKRGGGKVVTLVEQISGDGKAFLKALQKTLGTGGKVEDGVVLIQGDHVTKVERFLDAMAAN